MNQALWRSENGLALGARDGRNPLLRSEQRHTGVRSECLTAVQLRENARAPTGSPESTPASARWLARQKH